LLAALTSNDKVVVWDVDQRKVCRELPVGKIKARLLLFMDDGERLLIGDPDSSAIHLWNLQTGEEEEIPTLRHFNKGSWALSADQRWVLGLGQHGDGQLLDRQQGHVRRLTLETRDSSSGAFSADHSLFAVAARSGYVKLWDADSFTEAGQLKRFLIGAHSLTFSPDGTRLAAGSGDLEAVKLWDVRSQRELLNLEGQGSLFYRIRFSASGDLLATSPEKGPVHIWRAPSWEEIEAAEPEAGRLAENRSEDGS
jgi:WD40 repeat protein